ncbi:hypothetical protein PHMEG_00020365 [Phytophthora megakarya]|uniref:Integrase catalytic domain-containing protein n=1 Tax=Phytophthora megakarya TaxID=4795 RepID=A0A225VPA1_9STRA|nr:hypothetical protein PHMEG_00020365 [Phytophthora megakarya]
MFQCFLEYKASVETKHNRSLRRFVSNNGGEYLDGAFVKYCHDHGIQRDTTIAYTPEQNGVAEVRFRIPFNKVRTILIFRGSPKQLWGEAVLAMVYTYNRILASGIGMTSYERWHGHPPDVSNLRTFDSLAYVYVASKTNVQGRAGYAANQKGWKILDCNQGTIISSIHVSFDESFSAAACDLKRQEFRKLASRHAMDFEYYSRAATSEVDLLFYYQRSTEEKPFTNDIVLLEDFVAGFDLDSVNISTTWPQLRAYSSSSAPWVRTLVGPQALISESVHPIIRAKQAVLLVAIENLKCKESLCAVVAQGMGHDPATYRDAMARPDVARWREATDAEIASLLKNKTWTRVNFQQASEL